MTAALYKSQFKENSKDWWEEKYQKSGSDLVYGKSPSEFLIKHLPLFAPGSTILELGCGEGRNSVAMSLKGHKVRGLDFSGTAITRANVLARDSGVQVEFKAVDLDLFMPELLSVDVMVAVDFKPQKTLLANLNRGLKQNGLLLVDGPSMALANQGVYEAFECYQPNELLRSISGQSSSFRILHYSEMETENRVLLLARKTQLF